MRLIEEMSDQEFIGHFISEDLFIPDAEHRRVSCLIAGYRDARRYSSRNIVTAEFEPNECYTPDCWLSMTGYMVCLELIGKIFRKDNYSSNSGDCSNPIFKCIRQFYSDEFSDAQIHAIVALRNSFVHSYSLINIPREDNKFRDLQRHKFTINFSLNDAQIVKLPDQPWTTPLRGKEVGGSESTLVNGIGIGNMVEEILINLRELHSCNLVRFVGTKDRFDIAHEFTFVIS
jgi:hypothetical protein